MMVQVQATHRPRLPLWLVIAAGGIITAVSLGVRSTFGLLLDPIADGLGTDLGSISLAIAVQNLLWGFSQPIAGALSDRFGAARTLAAGGLLYAIALLLMSTAEGSGLILLSGGFITGIAIGAASFAVVLSAVGRMAPPEKRSMMLGVVSAVGSLGQFVLIPIARWLLDNGSWQRTSVVLAILTTLVIVLAPAMRSVAITSEGADDGMSEENDAASPRPDLRSDLRRASSSRSYKMLNGAFFVCGFHVTFIGVHLAGFVDDAGISATTASTALALIGLFNVVGSLLAGYLGGRMRLTMVLAGIYGLRAVVIAAYALIPTSGASTIIFGMAMGVLWLSTVAPTGAIVTQQFGPTNAGALFGIVFLSHQVGSFLGAWMGGEFVDITGSYSIMWWMSVFLGIAAMLLHLLIDESPVPEPPAGFGGFRLAPVGTAAVITAAGVAAAFSISTPVEASTGPESTSSSPPSLYCVLGPMVHERSGPS